MSAHLQALHASAIDMRRRKRLVIQAIRHGDLDPIHGLGIVVWPDAFKLPLDQSTTARQTPRRHVPV